MASIICDIYRNLPLKFCFYSKKKRFFITTNTILTSSLANAEFKKITYLTIIYTTKFKKKIDNRLSITIANMIINLSMFSF